MKNTVYYLPGMGGRLNTPLAGTRCPLATSLTAIHGISSTPCLQSLPAPITPPCAAMCALDASALCLWGRDQRLLLFGFSFHGFARHIRCVCRSEIRRHM
jgi:hypothetical protein